MKNAWEGTGDVQSPETGGGYIEVVEIAACLAYWAPGVCSRGGTLLMSASGPVR